MSTSADRFNPKSLALSGGGFRAAMFHLGVIGYLRKTARLEHITDIYAVSGGSILAAHLVRNWDKYKSTDELFGEAAGELVAFCQRDVRGRIVRRWLAWWLLWLTIAVAPYPLILQFVTYKPWWILSLWLLVAGSVAFLFRAHASRTAWLQREYDRFLRRSKLLDLGSGGRPAVHLLATDLTTGDLAMFTERGLTALARDGTRYELEHPHLSASYAVTASSAFPPLFPPVRISRKLFNEDIQKLPYPHYLTDGGVFDNLGVHAARHDGKLASLLVSNAERRFDIDLNEGFQSLLSRGWRTSDILMQRVSSLETQSNASDSFCHAELSADNLGDFLAPHLQRFVRNIRTDLDDFCPLEIQLLYYRGYGAAMAALDGAGYRPGEITFGAHGVPISSNQFWLPFPNGHPGLEQPVDEAQTSQSSTVRVRLLSRADPLMTCMLAAMGLLLVAALVLWPVSHWYFSRPILPTPTDFSVIPMLSGSANTAQAKIVSMFVPMLSELPIGIVPYLVIGDFDGHRAPAFDITLATREGAAISKAVAYIAIPEREYTRWLKDAQQTSMTFRVPSCDADEIIVILLALSAADGETPEKPAQLIDIQIAEVNHE